MWSGRFPSGEKGEGRGLLGKHECGCEGKMGHGGMKECGEKDGGLKEMEKGVEMGIHRATRWKTWGSARVSCAEIRG